MQSDYNCMGETYLIKMLMIHSRKQGQSLARGREEWRGQVGKGKEEKLHNR